MVRTIASCGDHEPTAVATAIEHILRPIGRRLDRSNPTVDARLPDGSRVSAVIEPIAVDGPCLTIRRFAMRPLPLSAFASPKSSRCWKRSSKRAATSWSAGRPRRERRHLLNALAAMVPDDRTHHHAGRHRRVTAPASARRAARGPSGQCRGCGRGALANCCEPRCACDPTGWCSAKCRGAEAVQLVQAMNTGHDGSMATVHANSAIDAVARLCSLVLQEVPGWPLEAIHDQVRRSIDVVIHVGRTTTTGGRSIEVCESDADQRRCATSSTRRHEVVLGRLRRGRR